MRILLFLIIVITPIAIFNLISIRGYRKLHEKGRRIFYALAVLGNLVWLVFPMVARPANTTPAARLLRALLGPPWFSWMMFIILYSAVLGIAGLIWLAAGSWRKVPYRSIARPVSMGFLGAVIFIFVVGFYQALVPLYMNNTTIRVAGLPRELAGTRIALLSDLHVGLFTRCSRLAYISERVAKENPDFVVVAGDLIDDDPYYVPKFLRGFDPIPVNVPIYATLGNHEMYGDPRQVVEQMRGSRVRLLVNSGERIAVRGRSIWLGGLSEVSAEQAGKSEFKPDVAATLRGRSADDFPILAAHQPKALDHAIRAKYPLLLCAHSHGGQFGFRSLRWTLAGLFIPYDMGLYDKSGTQMFVCTGTGYWVVPVRFGMTPEIAMIELQPR